MEPKKNVPFVGYDYKEITVRSDQASLYLDCYENFGWKPDDNMMMTGGQRMTVIRMKRDRKIINKMELTRLQRHFEACVRELDRLEQSRTSTAMVWALTIGIIGTAFMAGSVFAVTHEPPLYLLCIVLAIPAFIGWILPYFVYRRLMEARARKIQPLIEAKYEEIYEVCEKGHALL